MGRLMNDISYIFGRKPRSVIHYIDPNGNLQEIPFDTSTKQGAKEFEISVKGEDSPKRWKLVHAPYIDELGRRVYICPYNSLTNVSLEHYLDENGENSKYYEETISKLLSYIEPALVQEFNCGVEWERRRQEGKGNKKKPFPLATVLIIGAIVMVVVIIIFLAIAYFGA